MKLKALLFLLPALFIFTVAASAQNRFEGYSLVVEADSSGACPIKYLPSAGDQNAIQVYLAGTNMSTPATGLKACSESRVAGAGVAPNGLGQWCFEGPEEMYEVKLKNGMSYLWYPITENTGYYNVKDFRPVTRRAGATPQYIFSEPADYTKTIRNAVAFVAARQGGTLRFPDGDYVVGTTDGNTRDPNFQAITLPSGIIVEGTSANLSVPTTTLPFRTSATRIRLRNNNQAIFRIGGCTNAVTFRNIELLGNTGLATEARRDTTGTYGIEGVGKVAIDPRSRGVTTNSSQVFKIENVTFQNFDRGIFVHNLNDRSCNPQNQVCDTWQFDYVLVDHGFFLDNKTGIWIDTYNTDWKISNTVLSYTINNAPGDGIHVQKAGSVLIEQTFGGGNDYGAGIGGTFLNIDTVGTITIVGSGSERSQRSIYTNPAGSTSSLMITVIGSVFGDKIDLNGRLNYISTGNFYGARTVEADPAVNITSTGDRFCYDALVLPGRCVDAANRPVNDPGFSGGRVMFQSGRIGEGTGANRIQSRPNFFGYNVELGDGLVQYDPNVTFRDITAWAAGTADRPPVKDGALVYCKDCKKSGSGTCTQGSAGTDGAFAKRINGQWRCD
jgi:hypothetical protein